VTDDVERVFADIDTDHRDGALGYLGHGRAPRHGRPWPALIAGGAGTRPDHPHYWTPGSISHVAVTELKSFQLKIIVP